MIPRLDVPEWMTAGLGSLAHGAREVIVDLAVTSSKALLEEGRQRLTSGRTSEARDLFVTTIAVLRLVGRTGGDRARSLIAQASSMLGEAAEAGGDITRAQRAYRDAIRLFEDAGARDSEQKIEAFAVALHGAGQVERAIEILDQPSVGEPSTPLPAIRLARWLTEVGRDGEALSRLRGLVLQFPTRPEPALALADVLESTGAQGGEDELRAAGERLLAAGRPEDALDIFDRLGSRHPADPSIFRARARALSEMGLPESAAHELDRAIDVGGDTPGIRIEKAASLVAAGEPSAALDELRQAGAHAAEDAHAAELRGLALRETGDDEGAVRELTRACELSQGSAAPHAALGALLHRLGRPEQALPHLDAALALAPGDAEALQLKAGILLARGDTEPAVELFRQAVAVAPRSGTAWAGLGKAHWETGKFEAAIGAMERAQELEREDAGIALSLGQMLSAQKKFNRAKKQLQHAIELDPLLPQAHIALGDVLQRLGRQEEALASFRRALDLVTPSGPALTGVERAEVRERTAQILEAGGHLEAAATELHEAAELAPSADLHAHRAELLQRSGHPAEALVEADTALHLDDKHPGALTVRGAVLGGQRDRFDDAVASLRLALEADPDRVSTMIALGDLYNRTGRLEDAKTVFLEAVGVAPDDLAVQRGLGDVYRKLGNYDAAFAAFESALVIAPHDLLTHRLLGHTFLAANRPDDALITFQRALEAFPVEVSLLTDTARAHLALEDYEDALDLSARAVRAAPENRSALVLHATVLCLVGDFAPAADLLRPVVAADPRDADAHLWLAWALENQGPDCLPEALTALRRTLGEQDAPYVRKELATVLLMMQDPQAEAEFQRVLESLSVDEGSDPDDLEVAGWCLYGLGQFDKAASRYRLALRLAPDSVDVHFDLALADLCAPKEEAAVAGYERAIRRTGRKPRLRRLGLLRVALVDLDGARRVRGLDGPSVMTCREMVAAALRDAETVPAEEIPDQPAEPTTTVAAVTA